MSIRISLLRRTVHSRQLTKEKSMRKSVLILFFYC